MPQPISILLDAPQIRLKEDAISTLVSGRDWDPTSWGTSYGTWVDPITNTAMLEPGPRNPAWTTSNSGIFAKLGMSDFTLTGGGTWQEDNVDQGGPFLLYTSTDGNTASAGVGGLTNAEMLANQAMCIEAFIPSQVVAPYGVLNFGWSNDGDGVSGVSGRLYADGHVEIWKYDILGGTYSVSGKDFGYYDPKTGALGQAPNNGFVQLLLIPCRDRELLVVSPTMGGGFSHVFLDLPEQVPGQTITAAEKFWFFVVNPVNPPKVRVARIQYAALGTIAGRASGWRLAPPIADLKTVIYQALSQQPADLVSIVAADSGFANPNSIPNPVQLQFTLTNGGAGADATPFLYGGRAWYESETANTAAPDGHPDGLEVVEVCRSASLDVGDSINGSRLSLLLMRPQAIADAGCPNIKTQCCRPIALRDMAGLVGTFVGEPPDWDDAFGFDEDGYDRNQDIEIHSRDYSKFAEDFCYSDPIPLDGLTLTEAYTEAATPIGFTPYISPSADSFSLPIAGVSAAGDWNSLIDVGDRGLDWLDRLHTTYAATWFHSFGADGNPVMISPDEMPSTSAVTLYRCIQDAIDAGVSLVDAPYRVYRNYRQHVLEPEANDIWVSGYDMRSSRPILLHYRDAASADPTTPVASRGDNWVGYPKKGAWSDTTLTTLDACQYCIDLLKLRLPVARKMCEFDCEYLDGITKGMKLTLDKADGDDPVVVRLKRFSADFQLVPIDPSFGIWRPAKYIGEIGDLVCPIGVPGTTLVAIRNNWKIRGMSKFRAAYDAVMVGRRPPINIQEA